MSSLFCEIDWSQFWPGMIATFVGIALPLLIDAIIKKLGKAKRKKELFSDFNAEINHNKTIIDEWNSEKVLSSSSTKLLKTVVYDLAISTGEMSLLDSKRRRVLAELYDLIADFNNCLQEQTRFFLGRNELNNEIKHISDDLKTNILKHMQMLTVCAKR